MAIDIYIQYQYIIRHQVVFSLNTNALHRSVVPWTWRVFVAPWADPDPGQSLRVSSSLFEAGEEPPEGFKFLEVFNKAIECHRVFLSSDFK